MKYNIQKGYAVQKKNGLLTIFNSEKSTLYSLNETATFIYEALKRKVHDSSIPDLICESFNISKDVAKKDVKVTIRRLIDKEIIQAQSELK